MKILVNKNKGKVHLKDDDEGDPSKKDNFLQNKSKTKWMTQWASCDKIR